MSNPKPQTAADPAFDWTEDERIFPAASGGVLKKNSSLLSLKSLPQHLPFKKLFVFFAPEVDPVTGADFGVTARVNFFQDRRLVGWLPASICYDPNSRAKKSRFTVFGNSQTGGSEPGFIGLATPFSTLQKDRQVALTPWYGLTLADRIEFEVTGIDEFAGSGTIIGGYRIWMGLMSANYNLGPK